MPTYLYECEKCGRFEEFQKITDEPLTECPDCKSPVKRIIGAPGIIFKGSGFYSTDSRSSGSVINSQNQKTDAKADSTTTQKSENKESKTGNEKAS